MAAALGLGRERKIDAARAQRLADHARILAHEADTYAWLCLGKAAQDRRHDARDDVVRYTEPHLAFERRRAHGSEQLVILHHQASCLSEQPLAGRRQDQPPPLAFEQACIERFFQSLDLLRYGRLAHPQNRGRARDAARFHHGQESAQQGDIEIPQHSRYISIVEHLYQKHSIVLLARTSDPF
jgi:hypothetical protein